MQQVQHKRTVPAHQYKTPYFDALLEYVREGVVSFHCPGHKHGKGVHQQFREFLGTNTLSIDLTQILGLDDLQQPTGVLKEAHQLAAQAYGADLSYFLVNGSSSGNHAMLLAVCNPGDEVILPRNAHKSVASGLIFSGVIPRYMMPEFDEELQVDHTVTVDTVKRALMDYPNAKAVMIVSPTYYGATADLCSIVKLCHEAGKALLVDEAWGPHLHFHPNLPISATEAGADLVVNSTHKLLGALSQSSILHCREGIVDAGRLEAVIRLFLSTSPSCLLLASLDVARMQMVTEGEELLDQTIALANDMRVKLNKIPGLYCLGKEIVGRPGVYDWDPTKLTVTARDIGYTGYEIEKIMRYKYLIQLELADLFNTIALITIGTSKEEGVKLVEAFQAIALKATDSQGTNGDSLLKLREHRRVTLPDWPSQRLTPREAFVAPHKVVPIKEAAGMISTELVTPYPPGIPIVCPGEELTKDLIEYLFVEIEEGSRITGLADSNFETIRVVK